MPLYEKRSEYLIYNLYCRSVVEKTKLNFILLYMLSSNRYVQEQSTIFTIGWVFTKIFTFMLPPSTFYWPAETDTDHVKLLFIKLRKYHRRERTTTRRKTARRQKTDSHVDFLNIIVDACVRVADVMVFTFVSLMPVHNVCRICMIIKQ